MKNLISNRVREAVVDQDHHCLTSVRQYVRSSAEQPDVANKKERLLKDVERMCYRFTPGKVERILFIGLTGQGKSSIINTIAKQINGEYFQIAPVGSGVTSSKSQEILEYKHCGSQLDVNEDENSTFYRIHDRLPHLIDYAGLEDQDTSELTELFERFIEGAIPPYTTVQSIERDQRKYKKDGGLKARYPDSRPEWKVSKIVFVHSCKSPVPTRLIRCLLKALMSTDEDATTVKFKGSVYLLITKYDLVDPDLIVSSDDEGSRQNDANAAISMDEFKVIEDELANQFSIQGNLEFNRICWSNYGTQTGYDNINIDVIVLEFLKQMMMPTITREEAAVIKPPAWLEVKIAALDFLERLHLSPREIVKGFVGLFLGIFVLWYFCPFSIRATAI